MNLTGWHAIHLFVLGAWGGLVAGETVIEIASLRVQRLQYAVARFHHLIDRFVEIPLLIAVLVSGLMLLPSDGGDLQLWVKVGFGLGAIVVNLACVVVVVRRGRYAEENDSVEALMSYTRLVFMSVFVGVPFALTALVMGGQRVGWW